MNKQMKQIKQMKVYLDNGATTMVAKEVVKAMQPYFTENYGNASSLHSFGREAAEALERSRKVIADSIGAEPREIIFTSGGTESDNLAIKGIAFANNEKGNQNGNHIITSKIEHPAVLQTCKSLEKQGFNVTYLIVDNNGFVDLKQLDKSITKKTILVSIMHANNEIGTIQDIKKIGDICKKHNVLFHTDAVQSFTKVPINVKKVNVDLISLSSHKIHGPKGVGALFIKNGTNISSINDGGGHEFHFRAGTENISGIVGFAKAVELAVKDNEKHIKIMTTLRDYLIKNIEEKIQKCQLDGDRKQRLCNNAHFVFNYIEGESLLMHLDIKGVAISTASACSSKSLEPSHVLLAIGLKPEIAHGSIRFTLSKYTTKKEIDYTVNCVAEVVQNLRKISPLH